MTERWEVDWCRRQWDMLRDRGVWGIPRSGLILEKREAERELVVTARMPHDPAMRRFDGEPLTVEELREQQDDEIRAVAERFAEFGITVRDEPEGG